jgi:hypothetical protein
VPVVFITAAIGLLVTFWTGNEAEAPELRAAIVDQLGLNEPNPEFVQTAKSTLEQAGYAVDYYPPEQVTVDFYRTLPKQKYVIIVFRVHIARFDAENLTMEDPVRRQEILDAFTNGAFLFTSELYDKTKYTEDLQKLRLFGAQPVGSGDTRCLGSRRGLWGRCGQLQRRSLFSWAAMVCSSTTRRRVRGQGRGSCHRLGWPRDRLASISHPGAAEARDGGCAQQAVRRTMSESGRARVQNSLKFYPRSAGDRTLPRG